MDLPRIDKPALTALREFAAPAGAAARPGSGDAGFGQALAMARSPGGADAGGAAPGRIQVLRELVDGLPGMAAYIDPADRHVVVNRAYATAFDATAAVIEGRTLAELIGASACARALPYCRRARSGEQLSFDDDLPAPGGGLQRLHLTLVPDLIGVLGVPGLFLLAEPASAAASSRSGSADRQLHSIELAELATRQLMAALVPGGLGNSAPVLRPAGPPDLAAPADPSRITGSTLAPGAASATSSRIAATETRAAVPSTVPTASSAEPPRHRNDRPPPPRRAPTRPAREAQRIDDPPPYPVPAIPPLNGAPLPWCEVNAAAVRAAGRFEAERGDAGPSANLPARRVAVDCTLADGPLPVGVDTPTVEQLILNLLRHAAAATAPEAARSLRQAAAAPASAGFAPSEAADSISSALHLMTAAVGGMARVDVTGPTLVGPIAETVDRSASSTRLAGDVMAALELSQITGVGIALALGRGIVEIHGGRLWSEASGGTLRASMVLPLCG